MKPLSLRRRACLVLPLCSLIVSGCGNQAMRPTKSHPVADLTVTAKPLPTPDIVTNDTAAAAYSAAVEKWGEDGWAAVARLCRWHRRMGARVDCPVAGE